MIRKFFEGVSSEGKVPVDTLVEMAENGVLQIRSPEMNYSLSEVAKIFGRDVRTVSRWIEEGKLKAVDGVSRKVIPSYELDRFYETFPMQKNQTCIYIGGETIDDINDTMQRIVNELNVNKYRCHIFADLDGSTDGLTELLRYLIRYRGKVFTNVSLVDKDEYVSLILSATNTIVQIM